MGMNQLLSHLSQLFFLFLGIVTVIDFARRGNRVRRDIALMFASIAIPVAAGLLNQLADMDRWLVTLGILALVAQPYLLVRLVEYLRPVPKLIKRLTLVGMVFCLILVILFSTDLPPTARIIIVGYFVIIDGYAMLAFIRGAMVTSGVVQQRLRFAGAGSGMLGLALGIVGLSYFAPSLQDVASITTRLFAIISAMSFYIGFAPPRWFRRVWQFAELRAYLLQLNQQSTNADPNITNLLSELCASASRAVGGIGSMVLELNGTTSEWQITYSSAQLPQNYLQIADKSAVQEAWQAKSPMLVTKTTRLSEFDRQLLNTARAETFIIVPIQTSEHVLGLLLVFLQHSSLFPDDDLELLDLLARQTTTFSENIRLIEQLKSYSGSLEQRIEERTQALTQSEERFRNIFEQAAVGIAEVSLEGQFVQTNERFCKILGYTASELRELTFQEITHPDDLAADLEAANALFTKKISSYSIEKRYYHKKGHIIWVNLTSSLVQEPTAQSKHYLKIIEDVSERKQIESARREAEARFARVLDATAEAVITVDTFHRIILFNQSAERIFGYTADEMIGQPLDILLPPDVITRHSQFIQNFAEGLDIARGMGQRRGELRARHKDGIIFPIEASISKLTENDQVILTVFIRDVTEQKRIEAARREVEARFARVLDATAEAVISIDSSQRIILFNQSAERIFGYTGSEMLGQSLERLLPPHIVQYHQQFVHDFAEGLDIARGMGQRRGDLSALHKDGSIFPIEASISKLTEGDQIILTVFIQDITKRKEAEEALKSLNEELEQRVAHRTTQLEVLNKELEAFSYSVSHDLRAPLRALDGFSQALLEDYLDNLDDDGQEYLNLIRSESQRMGQLIDDLLDLSRLTRTDLNRIKVNLSEIGHEIADDLRKEDRDRSVEFIIEGDMWVCADPRLMRIVLQNLMGNAWKYTGKQPVARIELGNTFSEDETTFFVRDNGVGFDMSYAHKLFGAFQRLHSAAEFEGNGIGLATVQRIIHQHGGTVRTQSDVNQGATFYFTVGQGNCG